MTEYIQVFKFVIHTGTTVIETIHIEDWRGAKTSIIKNQGEKIMPTKHSTWTCNKCGTKYKKQSMASNCEKSHSLRVPSNFKVKELRNEFDFLPDIKDNEVDMGILRSWAKYFRSLGVSFRITKAGNTFTLWKELRG
jgi:hypothetical protein